MAQYRNRRLAEGLKMEIADIIRQMKDGKIHSIGLSNWNEIHPYYQENGCYPLYPGEGHCGAGLVSAGWQGPHRRIVRRP